MTETTHTRGELGAGCKPAAFSCGRLRLWRAAAIMILCLMSSAMALASPPQNTQGRIELTQALALGYVSYTVRGMNTSSTVHLEIRNHMEFIVNIEIEEGTELVPSEGDVQRMAVTRDYRISVHGHYHNQPELVEVRDIDVACLDITRDAPSSTNTSWTVRRPQAIRGFLTCLDNGLQRAKERSPQLASQLSQMRPFLVQMALWQARGATRGQWIDFFVKYQKMPRAQAAQIVDSLKPLLDAVVSECGSLGNI
jgi:hypothetical protein